MREDTIMPGTVETMVVTTTVITVTEIWAQDLEQEFQVQVREHTFACARTRLKYFQNTAPHFDL